ncbi:UNVERIFIED_CONTAM: hypothetical protein RMT77_017268 [Armadillidium vulgare]
MFSCVLGIFAIFCIQLIQGQTADPVRVTVYYESLCPDSIRFFTEQLEPTYGELCSIMEVESYAYGFETEVARPSGGYEFTCQHGPDECYGNKLLDCGLEHIEDHETFLNFSFCVMAAEYPPSSGVECANQVSVSPDIIINCANSTEGENLLHDVGVSQSQLVPEVNYVPWIIINDEFTAVNLELAQINLKKLVCSTYQGEQPAECAS